MSRNDLSSFTCNIKKPVMTLPICKAVTKSGKPCSYRGRHNGYCKIHAAPGTLCDSGKKMGDCPICYEEVTKGTSTTTRCKHVFHKACLQRWMEEKTTCPMCRENIRPTTGQLRPSTYWSWHAPSFGRSAPSVGRLPPPPPPAPLPSHMIVDLGTFINENPNISERLPSIQQESLVSNRNVHYINSENELDDLLISVRNAPIDIRFTSNYWEG